MTRSIGRQRRGRTRGADAVRMPGFTAERALSETMTKTKTGAF